MGVLGIVPFLLKKCPQAIETIPSRFHSLEGKTIALDGTLITQRLHFTPDPRPYRHVLGWYQLVQELRQNNINLICVFDGKNRIPAKHNEVERRRLLRLQSLARGTWEKSRHERLLALTQALRKLETLPEEHQQEILKSLQVEPESSPLVGGGEVGGLVDAGPIEQREMDALTLPALSEGEEVISVSEELQLDKSDQAADLDLALLVKTITPADEEPISSAMGRDLDEGTDETLAAQAIDEVASLEDLTPVYEPTLTTESGTDALRDVERGIEAVSISESDIGVATLPETDISVTDVVSAEVSALEPGLEGTDILDHRVGLDELSPEWVDQAKLKADSLQGEDNKALTHKLLDLYDHYNRTTISGPDGKIHTLIEEPDLHDTVPIPISKAQLKHAQEEAKLWKELVISSENANINLARVVEMVEQFASAGLPSDEAQLDQEEDPSISERSAKLEEQSGLMAESLVRRAKPPTTLTYAESRLILEAMGIPCIESSIPYEAEALASSLVLHGFADFVGSEDTDVLVYNAPLLRNITNRKAPLQVIPPSVETGLGLSRDAFVDAAILMGTDFVRRVKKVGPNTAWRLMREYGSIERMLEEEPKFRPPDVAEYLEQVKIARMIFNTIPPAPSAELVSQGPWDDQAIFEVMSRFGLHRYLEDDQIISDGLAANYYADESTNF